MNETVVAGRVKRAVIGLDLLVTKNEVCCRSFMALLSLFFFYSPQSHSWPWLNYYPRSCDIKMPACTHKMGCIEIKRLPYSPMAGSLERRHDLLVFLNSRITHTSFKKWTSTGNWMLGGCCRLDQVAPFSPRNFAKKLHSCFNPATWRRSWYINKSLLLFMLLVRLGDVNITERKGPEITHGEKWTVAIDYTINLA